MAPAAPPNPFPPPSLGRTAAGFAVAAAIAGAARRSGSLAPSGAAAAVGVGTVATAAGAGWGALLIGFFASSTALSRWRRDAKAARTGHVVEKGGTRDAAQVLANGGVFAACVALGAFGVAPAALAGAAAGALGAAAADTWATEVGTAVGGTPRRLLDGVPVPPGTSGAVTPAGTLGMLAGAGAVALAARALGLGRGAAWGALAGGVAGALADTLAGATVQERRWCDRCAATTEQRVHAACGRSTRVVGGTASLDNDWVNALCTVVGAGVGAAVAASATRGRDAR